MKRFYNVLLIGAALLSGSVYGMQQEADVRDYADVMNHLISTANFRVEDDFESSAMTLPAIEEFIIDNHKQDERQYIRLCTSYLNKKFALSECDPQQVEMMFMERFFGDSPLAQFYLRYRQEVIGQLNLDKLDLVMKKVAYLKDIDTLLHWLPIFDETGHPYEQLFADALSAEINKRGLTNGMQSWERNILQKAGHLQGLCKNSIDPLHQKEQNAKDQRQQLRDNAEKRRDQIIAQIFNALKANQKDQFNALVQDELMGFDAPLTDHLNYVNNQIERRINNSKVKINNREELLKTWQNTFRSVQEQYAIEEDQFWNAVAQTENKRLKEQREQQEQLNQRLEQIRINAQRQIDEEQRRQAEELRQRQMEQQLRDRDEQQRQHEEQKRIQREQRNQLQPDFAKATMDRPNVNAGDPAGDASKGIVALIGSIGAPKLIAAAVVVGVCYWGYTKYKAYKEAQSAIDKASSAETKEQVVRNTQATTQQKKESVQIKRRVR